MSEELRYLLVKRGLYYGPDNRGYTGIKERAGRYLETDACLDSGVSAIHEDEAPMFSPACWDDVKVAFLLSKIAALEAELVPRTPTAEHMPAEGADPEIIASIVAEAICLDVAELPDRTSPDDWPEAMLVTAEELTEIVKRNLPEAPQASDAGEWVRVPREPTGAMIDRFVSRALCVSVHGDGGWSNYAREQWRVMIDADPAPLSGKD